MINFEHRPYHGNAFRPTPEIHFDADAGRLIVATPWGPRSSARKVVDRITDYVMLTHKDDEATAPFERLTCLSHAANNLRTAVLLANDALYREDNSSEYHSGVELFAASFADNEFVWLQVGQPHIYLARRGRELMGLGSALDLSVDLSEGNDLLPALPSQLLGLDVHVNLTINSFRIQPEDKVLLLSHSAPPSSIFGIRTEDLGLDDLSLSLAKFNANLAFWLGMLDVR